MDVSLLYMLAQLSVLSHAANYRAYTLCGTGITHEIGFRVFIDAAKHRITSTWL
jgi:hypothetical protein